MAVKLKKSKKKGFRNFSPDYSFSAPPYNKYSAFQPGAYYRMYHRIEAEKMKRSHDWVRVLPIAEKVFKKIHNKMVQEYIPPVKTYIKEGILNVEIGEHDNELIEEFPIIRPSIEEGVVKIELGDKDNRKVVYIDLIGYWSIVK
jgi:hypothetical protein